MTTALHRAALAALLALATVACSGTPVEISNIPRGAYDLQAGRPIEAEETGFQLLLWFPIGINDRHMECWLELQRQAPESFITDIAIIDSWTYWLIGTSYTVRMEAMAYPYR